MWWLANFAVFVVAHVVGDFLLQTDHQAINKHNGLSRDPVARRALLTHVATYSVPIVGACVWVGHHTRVWLAVLGGVLIVLEHLIQDDGRLLHSYCRRVKGLDIRTAPGVGIWVDQSFHIVAMFGVAILLTV